jgi:hypothetical protein
VVINGDVIKFHLKPILKTRGERNTAYPEDESA